MADPRWEDANGVWSAAMADATTSTGRAMMFRRWPAVVAFVALAWVSACNSSSTSSPSLAANPSGSEGPPPPAACASIDLRTPTGEGLQLTGLWRSPDGGTYYLRQAGSCVWFVGLSGDTGAPGRTGTSEWTNAFFGTLQSDFTLRGEWADLPWGRDTGVGELTWGINFADVAGQEAVTLEVTAATSAFGGQFLIRPEAPIDLHVRLQDSPDCLSVVTDDGEVYELLITTFLWSVSQPFALIGPGNEVIHVGDEFDLSGEVARGTAFCGPGTIIFGDEITVSP